MSSWAAKTAWVLEKELRSEYRAKYAINAMLLFCITCVAVVSFALGGVAGDTRVQAALIWVLVFFAAMSGLSRGFVKEHEVGTIQLLRAACDPSPVFFGKALFNLILIIIVQALLCALFVIFLNVRILNPWFYAATASAASVSIAVLCTLISAIVAGARVRGTLFPILSFPVLLPVFSVAIQASRFAIEGAPFLKHIDQLYFLGAYAGVSIIICSFLFDFLFYD